MSHLKSTKKPAEIIQLERRLKIKIHRVKWSGLMRDEEGGSSYFADNNGNVKGLALEVYDGNDLIVANLEYLSLTSCGVKKTDFLSNQKKLKHLFIGGNLIEDISVIC